MAVKKVGVVTEQMHKLKWETRWDCVDPTAIGSHVNPPANATCCLSRRIGMAPVRAFLEYCLKHREDYGRIDLVHSASTYDDLVFKRAV